MRDGQNSGGGGGGGGGQNKSTNARVNTKRLAHVHTGHRNGPGARRPRMKPEFVRNRRLGRRRRKWVWSSVFEELSAESTGKRGGRRMGVFRWEVWIFSAGHVAVWRTPGQGARTSFAADGAGEVNVVGSLWLHGLLRSPRCPLRSSWSLSRSPRCALWSSWCLLDPPRALRFLWFLS
jgi:hypothetical protein